MTDRQEGLRLLAPDPHTVFEISPIIPVDAQRVRLTVGAPTGTQAITYLMDGEELGTVDESPWALWWTLAPGDHELIAQATLADGTVEASGRSPFSVTTYVPPQTHNAREDFFRKSS